MQTEGSEGATFAAQLAGGEEGFRTRCIMPSTKLRGRNVAKSKLLFILGAGSSHSYGMPLGDELLKEICGLANDPNMSHPSSLSTKIVEAGGSTHDALRAFCLSLQLSGQISIDTFLSKPQISAQSIGLGKLCIAGILANKERGRNLFNLENPDHWYRHLWNAMQRGASDPNEVPWQDIRIITFNYDRSLECFLHHATRESFNLPDDVAFSFCKRLAIHHVYGDIGPYHWLTNCEEGRRSYSKPQSNDEFSLAAKGLKVIPELRDSDEPFMELRKWAEWASHICYLGFGVDLRRKLTH